MIGTAARLLASGYLALVLCCAGVAKMRFPVVTAGGLISLFPLDFSSAVRFTRLLAALEVGLGCLAVVSLGSPLLAAPLVVFFLAAAGYSAALSRRAPGTPCGCFGGVGRPAVDHSQTLVSLIFGFVALAISTAGEAALISRGAVLSALAFYWVGATILLLRTQQFLMRAREARLLA